MAKSSRQLSEHERAERRRQARERLQRAAEELLSSDGWSRWRSSRRVSPLTGDSHAHLLAPMEAFAESLGYSVSFETIEGAAGGWCDPKNKRIVIDADVPANAQLRTLIPWRRWRIRTFGMPVRGRCRNAFCLSRLAGCRD